LSSIPINEEQVDKSFINNIFKYASNFRSKPSTLGKVFKNLKKDAVSVDDLRKAWIDGPSGDGSDGYSNDSRDIRKILTNFGYSNGEIDKVFNQVFKAEEKGKEYNIETIKQMAALASKYGIIKQLKSFIETEFPKDLKIKNIVIEDINQIFLEIVKEQRSNRMENIQAQEKMHLGRVRK